MALHGMLILPVCLLCRAMSERDDSDSSGTSDDEEEATDTINWAEEQSTGTYKAIGPVFSFYGLEHFKAFAGLCSKKWAGEEGDGVLQRGTWVLFKEPRSDPEYGVVHHFARLWKKPDPDYACATWKVVVSNQQFWAVIERAGGVLQLVPVNRITDVVDQPQSTDGHYFERMEIGVHTY